MVIFQIKVLIYKCFEIFWERFTTFKKQNGEVWNSIKFPIKNTWGNWVLTKILYSPQDCFKKSEKILGDSLSKNILP